MRLVYSSIILLVSIATLSQAELAHLPDSMGNSYKIVYDRYEGSSIKVFCNMQGPPDTLIVWRLNCKTIFPQGQKYTYEGIIKITTKTSNPACNKTNHCHDTLNTSSVFHGKLPPEDTHCSLICCGYAEVQGFLTNAPENGMTESPISADNPLPDGPTHYNNWTVPYGAYSSHLRRKDFFSPINHIIWPTKPPPMFSNNPDLDLEGGCLGLRLGDLALVVESQNHIYLELIVYMMMGISVFSLLSTVVCICMGDNKSNRAKREEFASWARTRRKRPRSTIGTETPKETSDSGNSENTEHFIDGTSSNEAPHPPVLDKSKSVDNLAMARHFTKTVSASIAHYVRETWPPKRVPSTPISVSSQREL